jgi:Fe-S cluster assembly protein SufB
MTTTAHPELEGLERYKFGWADSDVAGESARRGLSEEVVRDISALKDEPQWMLDLRLKGLKLFRRKPMPAWGADLTGIDFDNIKYFVRSTEKQAASWDDLPADIKSTYDKLGIPEAEKQRLIAGVAAQYESEVIDLPRYRGKWHYPDFGIIPTAGAVVLGRRGGGCAVTARRQARSG